jgi:hypothetical protein
MSVCESILGAQLVWIEQGKGHKEKEVILVKSSGGLQRVLNRTPDARPFEANLARWPQWPGGSTIVLRLASPHVPEVVCRGVGNKERCLPFDKLMGGL